MELKPYQPSEYEQQAIDLINSEKNTWQDEQVNVANDTDFFMRDEIADARKNYYSKFEDPIDRDTGRHKLFVPMIEWTVETVVKNTDLDTKDIIIKSPKAQKNNVAGVVRLIVLHFLKKMNFGEFLNDFNRRLAIDGTAVAKVYNKYSTEYKRNMPHLRIVDPLNIVIDPAAYSLHEVPIIERNIMTRPEIEKQTGWVNVGAIQWSKDGVPTTSVFERHGLTPLSVITKKKEDEDTWVEAVVTCSALEEQSKSRTTDVETIGKGEQAFIFHKAKLADQFKPYEEAWLKRVPGRWHGRGIPEALKDLNTWLNTVVNIRRDELTNKLAGKYKIRKGAGITRQMLESIKAGGAIPVDNMDDIQELVERDVQGSAYEEPNAIMSMADRVTGAFEMARGETLPSSMPATTAVLQDKGSRTTFALIQENVGLFLERLFQRHLIPMIIDNLKEGEILRITGDARDLKAIDDFHLNNVVNNKILSALMATGKVPSLQDVDMMRQAVSMDLQALGKDRDIKILKKYFDTEYDVEIIVKDEKMDTAVQVRNLIDLIQSQMPGVNAEELAREALDIMGLSSARFASEPPPPPQITQPGQTPTPTAQGEFQRANIPGQAPRGPKTRGVPTAAAQQGGVPAQQ